MSDVGSVENQAVSLAEQVKTQVQSVMRSNFQLLPEQVVLPPTLKQVPNASEDTSDVGFRQEVQRVLPKVLGREGNVLVIQNIATQHAVATAPVFLEAGLDTYFTFTPENSDIRPSIMRGSYYHPDRVMSVALANEERIENAKRSLTREKLRGAVVTIDAHADFEEQNGEFDKFLPNEGKLKELDIRNIVLMGEFAPENAEHLTERRVNKKEDWDKSHIYDYLRGMKAKGLGVTLVGIDTRQSSRK